MLRYILLRKKGYLYKAVWKLYRNRKNSFDVLKITFFYEAFFQKQFITKVNRIVSRKKIISSNWFFFKFPIHLLLKYSESILYTHGLKLILFNFFFKRLQFAFTWFNQKWHKIHVYNIFCKIFQSIFAFLYIKYKFVDER